jgi:hypothetical protein
VASRPRGILSGPARHQRHPMPPQPAGPLRHCAPSYCRFRTPCTIPTALPAPRRDRFSRSGTNRVPSRLAVATCSASIPLAARPWAQTRSAPMHAPNARVSKSHTPSTRVKGSLATSTMHFLPLCCAPDFPNARHYSGCERPHGSLPFSAGDSKSAKACAIVSHAKCRQHIS